MRSNILQVRSVSKKISGIPVLSNVSLFLKEGEIAGLTGPVGAGKTTLLHIIVGLVSQDAGEIVVFSLPFSSARETILAKVGFASAGSRLSGYASVIENLTTYARLYDVVFNKKDIQSLLFSFGQTDMTILNKKIYALSSGENALVLLCKAFMTNPKLLIFDEITSHLDPDKKKRVLSYITQYVSQNNAGALWVSQNETELHKYSNKVYRLNKGKLSSHSEKGGRHE